jgi:uncharacterized C2H2 Zn-finger protein
MSECPHCKKKLKSQSALQQHLDAKHHEAPRVATPLIACQYCDRIFRSEEFLGKHLNTNHRFEPDICQMVPFPDAEGCWVYRKDFQGKTGKGFGIFVCDSDSCSRHWITAHAFRDNFGQSCQGCNNRAFPYIMWQFPSEQRNKKYEQGDGPPHDASRCDACKAGCFCTKIPSDPLPVHPPAKETRSSSSKPTPKNKTPLAASKSRTPVVAPVVKVRRDVSYAAAVSPSSNDNRPTPVPVQEPRLPTQVPIPHTYMRPATTVPTPSYIHQEREYTTGYRVSSSSQSPASSTSVSFCVVM